MIPPVLLPSCKSYGEKELFLRFRDDPATKDWIVLHSLDLSRHIKQVSGEIDFLVIVPNKGILCVEVKGCSDVYRNEGLWFYGKNSSGDPRGPFKQVNEAMQSLRAKLVQDRPDFVRIPIFSAVIFPYLKFVMHSDEWHDWMVIDQTKFKSMPISSSINYILDNWRLHFSETETANKIIKNSKEPYKEQCIELADHLRSNFEIHEDGKSIVQRNITELELYTKEQFEALDCMENNDRIIFHGAAGTGKTLLALEAMRRASAKGKKILFVCFNKHLCSWIKDKSENLKNVDIYTIHSLMLHHAGNVENDSSLFWQQILPETAQNNFIEKYTDDLQYDVLIIDEGQDLLHTPYLDFLDLLIKGGFSAGNWKMFGDFENQTIYKASNIGLNSFKNGRCGGVVDMQLNINCRNTPRIGAWTEIFGKLNPRYSRFRRPDNFKEPNIIYYKNNTEQCDLLIKTLDSLHQQGFKNEHIVILSPNNFENSVISSVKTNPWKDRLKSYQVIPDGGYLAYSTIQAFKGLESQVVIVTDLDKFNTDEEITLFYVAISRAIHNVTLLVSDAVKNQIMSLILKKDQS